MKLSIKNKMTAIAATLISFVVAGTSIANTTNTVPFEYSFEGLANDESIVGTNGWYAETNTYAVATNTANPYGGTFPISTTHNTHIVLNTENGALSNRFHNTGLDTNVWLDMLLSPTQWTDDAYPDCSDPDIDFAFFVNSNGNPVIYHTEVLPASAPSSNRFTVLDAYQIAPSNWVRVTIAQTNWGPSWAGFAVRLDGGAFLTNYQGKVDGFASNGGHWFLSANHLNNRGVESASFSGTGFLDDFCVKDSDPFGVLEWVIATFINQPDWATASPSSSFTVPDGANTSIVINVSNFWEVADVMTNGTSIGITNEIVLNAVSGNYSVRVDVVAQTTTSVDGVDVPKWWLNDYALDPNSPDGDTDTDTLSNWEEWLASTDPNDASSTFEIIDHYVTGGTGYVEWVSKAVDPDLPPFTVLRTTNLMAAGGGWTNAGVHNRPVGGGTNIWKDPLPPSADIPVYYRVSATN